MASEFQSSHAVGRAIRLRSAYIIMAGAEEGAVDEGERVDVDVNLSAANARRAAQMGERPSPLPYDFKAIGEADSQQFVGPTCRS